MLFTKNGDGLLEGDIAAEFFRAMLGRPEVEALFSAVDHRATRHPEHAVS